MPYQLLSIGDTTLDNFLMLDPQEARIEYFNQAEQICFNFGDKIPVANYYETLGGNSANAAVTGARLELSTAIWTIMGDDPIGARAKRIFEKEGIATEYFQVDEKINSKVSTVINFQHERTILIYGDHIEYHLPQFNPVDWIYLSAMGQTEDGVYDDIARFVSERAVKLVYQPGTYQLRMGAEKSKNLLAVTKMIVMNREEAADYVGGQKSEVRNQKSEIQDLLKGLLALGPKLAVITDGEKGAFVSDGQTMWSQGIDESVPVLEKTGAGDAYSSALAVALMKGLDVPTAMRWGAENSNGVIQKIGPQAGILTLEEMEQAVAKPNEKLKVNIDSL